ncbi:hypothetical protein [Cognataquiflexum rubidum]|uniref:hypothetical protein n=1 Tax=Cognataquiflexum rubidum TaxID=2922273 RepID=UPI001F146392|nr:hypothetical protein [Cognataquiflexum rubidum]MCH6233363.1 hypothetical protein [Cognataquiflexum rubidum]
MNQIIQALLFVVLTLLFLLFFYLGTGRNKRVLAFSAFWLSSISILALSDFFQDTISIPPRFLLVFLGNIILVVSFYKVLKATVIDYRYAMLIHTLRIPVEVFLFFLFLQKKVPEIMTFAGWNYDIFIGISALILLLAFLFFKYSASKKVLLIWNYVGLSFLINIAVIAVLAAPLPIQQFSFDQPNIAVSEFPYIFLPSFIVPIVFLMHILMVMQLNNESMAIVHPKKKT